MKIKRYQAPDMRSALRQIRVELGADAVILGTQSIDGGVEVCAADDGDRLTPAQAAAASGAAPTVAAPAIAAPAIAAPVIAAPVIAAPAIAAHAIAAAAPVPAPAAADQGAMHAELRSLRALLERQLGALAWNDFTRRDPLRARALTELTDLGMPRDEAWRLLQAIPAEALEIDGSRAHYEALAAALPVTDLGPLLQGTVALIGPPGAGKSTLLAKLAVRAVVEHGASRLGIVTLDTQRLGAGDQARAIGRLLGVETLVAGGAAELQQQCARWENRRLVLVDTAGALPRDADALRALQEQFAGFGDMRSLLVLPASAQPELLQCCLEGFADFLPVAAVLTRVDEALSLGGALAALLRQPLPLAAVCDGARIPEDLLPARALELVQRAVALQADRDHTEGARHAAA